MLRPEVAASGANRQACEGAAHGSRRSGSCGCFFCCRGSNLRLVAARRAAIPLAMDRAMDDVTAIPHCSHWGAYRVLVRSGAIVGVEPHPEDPAPSPIIPSITDWLDPQRRILQPMARERWLGAQ